MAHFVVKFDTPGVFLWTPPDVDYSSSHYITVQGAGGGDTAWRTHPVYGPMGDWPELSPYGGTRRSVIPLDPAETYEISVGNGGTDGTDIWTGGDGGPGGDGSPDGYDAADGNPAADPDTDVTFYYGGGGGGGAASHFGLPGVTPTIRSPGGAGAPPAFYDPAVPSSGKGGRGGGPWSILDDGSIGGGADLDGYFPIPGGHLPNVDRAGAVWIQWDAPGEGGGVGGAFAMARGRGARIAGRAGAAIQMG